MLHNTCGVCYGAGVCLDLSEMYADDKVYYLDDDISIILTLALLEHNGEVTPKS